MVTRFREDQLVVDFLLFRWDSSLGFVHVEPKGLSRLAAAGAEFLLNVRIETTCQLMV